MNVVVGGGWAGLAAAVELARHGRPVTLVEAAETLGGRARRVEYAGAEVDNGQHLVIGAYREVLGLLAILGIPEHVVFDRRPMELWMRALDGDDVRLRLPALPAPLHLLAGIAAAAGLSAAEKWQALRLCPRLSATATITPDTSVRQLLERAGQSERLIARLWEPLCLATLNARCAEASAAIFARVLRDAFACRRADSDLLIARCDLGRLLPDPARDYILARGGAIVQGRRATAIETSADRVSGVRLADGGAISASQLILAVPPAACLRLIRPLPALQAVAAGLERMRTAPICTVYLRYPPGTVLPFPLIGLLGTTAQWVCDLAVTGRDGLISAVVSGSGLHMEAPKALLVERVSAELARFFPEWPAPLTGFVLRERRATFLSAVGVDALRPRAATPCPNLHLAGDATATGYPATLEGAVRSGLECARRVLAGSSPLALGTPA